MNLILTLEQITNSRDYLLYKFIGYVNSHFVGDSKDYKFVMKHYFFFNQMMVL